MIAVINYDVDILRILLDLPHIDWNIKNFRGESALTIALKEGYHDFVKIMMEEVEHLRIDHNYLKEKDLHQQLVSVVYKMYYQKECIHKSMYVHNFYKMNRK